MLGWRETGYHTILNFNKNNNDWYLKCWNFHYKYIAKIHTSENVGEFFLMLNDLYMHTR